MKYEQLNLGSGGLIWPEYLNFDLRYHNRGHGYAQTDVIGDINNTPFKDGSFKLILCCHVIEHFYKTDAIAVIGRCYSLLKPGGKLVMEAPCIFGCYSYYVEVKKDMSRFIDFIYGGEDSRLKYGNEYAHRSGWTGGLMSDEMETVGFKIISVGPGQLHGMGKRDFRVEGIK